jgi:hypothetical protein
MGDHFAEQAHTRVPGRKYAQSEVSDRRGACYFFFLKALFSKPRPFKQSNSRRATSGSNEARGSASDEGNECGPGGVHGVGVIARGQRAAARRCDLRDGRAESLTDCHRSQRRQETPKKRGEETPNSAEETHRRAVSCPRGYSARGEVRV